MKNLLMEEHQDGTTQDNENNEFLYEDEYGDEGSDS
jgi:hypothetical protein